MLVYVIRHAHSLANAQLTQDLNSDLSPLGSAQAEALATRFSGIRIAAMYSSPFRRSLLTAEPIARAHNLPIFLRPELAEYHHLPPGTSVQTGLPAHGEICTIHHGVRICPDFDQEIRWPAADESFEEMIARVQRFAAFLKRRWTADQDVIVVIGHGSPIARLIEAWLTDTPGPSFRFVIENAATSALRYHKGVCSLVCLNEMSHLDRLPKSAQSNFEADGTVKRVPYYPAW